MSKNNNELWKVALGTAGLTSLSLVLLAKPLINFAHDRILKILMTDPYHENLWEFVSAGSKAGLQTILETNLRAQTGKTINRPLGSPKKFPTSNMLMFNIAQLHKLPTPEDVPVDMSVTLGPQAAKPMKIDMPIIITAMAYGLGLTEKAKIALAAGASAVGTAINNGEGPFLTSERKAAKHYILLYDRGGRNHDPAIIRQADAVEIQFGQGAYAGIGHMTSYKDMDPKTRKLLHVKPGGYTMTHARVPGVNIPHKDLPPLIKRLRKITGGVPIGAKLGAGNYLEKDLEILVDAGIDFVALDGAQAATKGSPPILQDDFGVPTVFAVHRAAQYLKKQGLKGKVTLIAGGGLNTPGEFLKTIALGADIIYIGSIALFAMAHTQVLKAMPWEPPPQVVFSQSHFGNSLNTKKAAKNLANFLKSCNEEMMEGIRALGKTSVKDVNKDDLASLDYNLSKALGIPLASHPFPH